VIIINHRDAAEQDWRRVMGSFEFWHAAVLWALSWRCYNSRLPPEEDILYDRDLHALVGTVSGSYASRNRSPNGA
jgi:hypothetical protein